MVIYYFELIGDSGDKTEKQKNIFYGENLNSIAESEPNIGDRWKSPRNELNLNIQTESQGRVTFQRFTTSAVSPKG